MKISTTIYLAVLTVSLGLWLLLRGHSGSSDLGGHLLFDWSDRLAEKGELGVDLDASEVAGIDLKISSGSFSLRRQPDGAWEVSGSVKDRADESIVKELLSYCSKAQIKDMMDISEVKDGKVSAASLGLDDANACRVTWLKADGTKLGEVRIGKTTPLDSGCSYVQMTGQERRPDIYFVSPDLRPLLVRPPDSFRDPHVSRYPSEVLVKMVVHKGEGEVEFSRTFQQAKPAPAKTPAKTPSPSGKNVIEVEPTPWVISRPLPNAPANQDAVKDFTATLCGAKVEAWVPYSETESPGDKPVVEVTLVPAGANAKGVTLQFFKDPTDPDPDPSAAKPADPGDAVEPAAPGDPAPRRRMAICRDSQRKASFKVDRELMDLLCAAESPTAFRSTVLASVDPGTLTTIRIEQAEGGSVEVVRVDNRWYWRPLSGGKFEIAAPERVEKLVTLLNGTRILDYASDSLSDPAAFGLDRPLVSITMAIGRHRSLEELTPAVDGRNSQTLRIGLNQKTGRLYANFTHDPFVFVIDSELPSRIPGSYFKWRSLTLPGFSLIQLTEIKQTLGTGFPLELHHDGFNWTAKRGNEDVTALLIPGAAEALALKAGNLQAEDWLPNTGDAKAALELPALRIEAKFRVFDDKTDKPDKLATAIFEFSPMARSSAQFCFGHVEGVAEPFLIKKQFLTDMAAPLLRSK